jgi:protein phosphatase
MGGHGAGEVASEIAVEFLARHLSTASTTECLVDAIQDASGSIYDAMSTGLGRPAMGTTVVGVMLHSTSCTFFNVGDSRAYILRGRYLKMHSVDHTPVDSRVPGSRSHALTQSLGGTLDRRKLVPHIEEVAIAPGDVIVLCSDGLTDLVDEDAIALVLRSGPAHPATALVNAALSAGGRDNITVVVVSV